MLTEVTNEHGQIVRVGETRQRDGHPFFLMAGGFQGCTRVELTAEQASELLANLLSMGVRLDERARRLLANAGEGL